MSAPKLPKSEKYWKNKGKREIKGSYKNVMLYTHDDLDGIYSAIAIRNHLENMGYNILGYGIVNYQDGWDYTTLHNDLINVAVDFASDHEQVDIYVDHHGEAFGQDNKKASIKTATSSAYEGILLQYGIPHCSNLLEPIDMIDSAKYAHYDVDIISTLYFDWKKIKASKHPKLTFAGAFNQMIKRSDYATLIEVIHNTKEPSIYAVYQNLLRFYGGNNIFPKTGDRKSFIADGKWRLGQMSNKTRGRQEEKTVFLNQKHFIEENYIDKENKIDLKGKGYQILGNLAFIPSGTWANGIRARAILEEDIISGKIPDTIDYILLQYGSTLQIVCYGDMKSIPDDERPVLKDGSIVKDLGKYMCDLLDNFKEHLNYQDPSTHVGSDDDITVAGGHGGIGSVSNICFKSIEGDVLGSDNSWTEIKYLDLFKNKIIQDISNIEWGNMKMKWSSTDNNWSSSEPNMDFRVMMKEDIRTSYKQKTKKEEEYNY